MPRILNWKLVSKLSFQTIREFKDWVLSSLNAITTHNNAVNCNYCNGLNKMHHMNDIRLRCNSTACNNENEICKVKYKILHCENKKKYEIYQEGEHASETESVTDCRGIQNYVKDMIQELFEHDVCMPKKIEIRLRSSKYANKFKNSVDIPSLDKIQNYAKYLRKKLGDNNKISDVKAFSKENKFSKDIDDDEFFVFGGYFGSGPDADHFQLGFASKTLLRRFPEGIIFHCDGTYKIIEFGFPLIGYGISDMNRKFWPVGFMFTSHEQKGDYLKFFQKMVEVALLVDVILEPKFMVIDACKAIA
jgi:hypothetical protein